MRRILLAMTATAVAIGSPAAIAANTSTPKAKKAPAKAKVLRATLAPSTTDALYAGTSGKAHLVDGKKNDKISLHMRRLPRNAVFTWHVHKAKAAGNPCDPASGAADPTSDTKFAYKKLRSNGGGNANSTARSRRFTAEKGATYYVEVHGADGTTLACGVLKGKAKKKPARKGGSKPASGKGKGPAPKTKG